MTTALLAAVVSGMSAAGLIFAFVGIVLVVGVVYFIMRKMESPQWLYTGAMIVGAVILLIIIVDVFFGAGVLIDLHRSR